MRTRLVAPIVVFVLASGACHDGGAPSPKEVVDPEPATAPAATPEVAAPEASPEVAEPRVAPVPPGTARASIAAVRMMLENCREPPDAATDTPLGQGQNSVEGQSAGDPSGRTVAGSCTQSTIQFAFLGQGDAPGRVVLQSLTLFAAGAPTPAGVVRARTPSAWNNDGQYTPWDEIIPAKSDLNASYAMSDPTWFPNAASGAPYVLEVVLTIDGVSQTVRSPEFVPEPPRFIET